MNSLGRASSIALILGAIAGGCAVDTSGEGPGESGAESVGVASEAFNPADGDPSDINAPKGHIRITKKALSLLAQRGLLPAYLSDLEKQKAISYGVNYGDHPWLGRKEAPNTAVPNRISERLKGATEGLTPAKAYYETNVESILAPDPRLKVNVNTNVWWKPGNDVKDKKPFPNYAMIYEQNVDIRVDVNDLEEALGAALLGAFSPLNDSHPAPMVQKFAVDNLYHYSLGDIRDIAPAPVAAGAANMKLYPLTRQHIMTKMGETGSFESLSEEKRDAIDKLVALAVNQPLVSGVQFGAQTYGAMLYQLARKFFGGSAAEPDINELQKAGPTVAGFSTGVVQGERNLTSLKLTFPHTFLGGNPNVCWNSSKTDACAAGKPTWPVWVPDQAPTASSLWTMETARPGRKNDAALIYLGWALHMMEDSAVPPHVANWTGMEHDVQDGFGDNPIYYQPTAGKEQFLMDNYMVSDMNALFGPPNQQKTRDQICQSIGVTDSQVVPGSLNWQAVRPLFINTAKTAYGQRQATVPANQAEAEGAKYVRNAVLGAMKLILCAMPSSGYWPTTFASGFVWSGSVGSGTVPAPSSYSYNSQQGANTITRVSTGAYRVDFPALGKETGGDVQVSAYGGTTNRCKVGSWGSNATTGLLSATVLCHDVSGTPTDTMFTASYVRQASGPGRNGGYLWANQPSTASYTPEATYQWNSSGARNTVQRFDVGNYSATFPGINVNGGTVEVTAYGGGNEHCKVGSWGSNVVSVFCFTPNGQPADAMFTLNFTDQSPIGTPSYHYAWADQPSSASYTPSTFYQKGQLASECSSAGTMTIQRSSVGNYLANIPALSATGSNVKITAYGGGTADSCQVTSWGGSSNSSQVGIFCHDAWGQPIDSYFTIVYSTNQFIIC